MVALVRGWGVGGEGMAKWWLGVKWKGTVYSQGRVFTIAVPTVPVKSQ